MESNLVWGDWHKIQQLDIARVSSSTGRLSLRSTILNQEFKTLMQRGKNAKTYTGLILLNQPLSSENKLEQSNMERICLKNRL